MVWRLGFFYFVVFGGFVALALWLPKYYVVEYRLSVAAASFATLLFTLPSGVVRGLGGWVSDWYGGRFVNRAVLWVLLACLVPLAVPKTTLILHRDDSDMVIGLRTGVLGFTLLVFIVGLAQGVGKAGVYRCIADHYPHQVGAVGGLVSMIGGLGRFVSPVIFGALSDLTQFRSSAFGILLVMTASAVLWLQRAIAFERIETSPSAQRVAR